MLNSGKRYAIMADVHANLEALQAALGDSKEQGCTHYAFLGDFVGYGADPKACLDIVRAMNAPCVKGNHDDYCTTDLPLNGFSLSAAKAVQWTRKQLTEEDREWLRNLPYVRTVEGFTIVHATLDGPERWGYAFDRMAAAASLTHQKTRVCFFGHTHVPVAFIRDTMVRGGTYATVKVEPGKDYFINPGAVGQPRDNNPKAAYLIYDMDKSAVELRRVAYDTSVTQRKIKEAGLGDI
jgi:predicted phosphodiesterase